MAEIKSGPKTSEGWLTGGLSGIVLLGDKIVPIPDNVAADATLMTLIIIAKYAALAALGIAYVLSRSRVKEAAASK